MDVAVVEREMGEFWVAWIMSIVESEVREQAAAAMSVEAKAVAAVVVDVVVATGVMAVGLLASSADGGGGSGVTRTSCVVQRERAVSLEAHLTP